MHSLPVVNWVWLAPNFSQHNMKHVVYGLKKGNRDPIIDHKTGDIIDDGLSRPVSLCSSESKVLVDYFFKSIRSQYTGHTWKIWQETIN